MTTAVMANTEKLNTLRALLEKARSSIATVLPKHISVDRIIKVALVATSRNPLLLQCTPSSLLKTVMQASQLGLEPDGALGQAYMVPFRNNTTGQYEVQFIVGYRGLIDLARRSGNILSIEARVVNEKDEFECSFGLEQKLLHRPKWTDDSPGKMIAVYAIARLKDGATQIEVMTPAQVRHIREKSRAAGSGPWVTDPDEMARKCVIKRIAKYLPLSVELAQAIALDNAAEAGEIQILDDEPDINIINIDPETGEVLESNAPQNRAEILAEEIRRGRGRPPKSKEYPPAEGIPLPKDVEEIPI